MAKELTFEQTIDKIIALYEKGMRVRSYRRLKALHIHYGICYASYCIGNDLTWLDKFRRYNPTFCRSGFWYPVPKNMYQKPLSVIKEECIKPRLEALKHIQRDLNKKTKNRRKYG